MPDRKQYLIRTISRSPNLTQRFLEEAQDVLKPNDPKIKELSTRHTKAIVAYNHAVDQNLNTPQGRQQLENISREIKLVRKEARGIFGKISKEKINEARRARLERKRAASIALAKEPERMKKGKTFLRTTRKKVTPVEFTRPDALKLSRLTRKLRKKGPLGLILAITEAATRDD